MFQFPGYRLRSGSIPLGSTSFSMQAVTVLLKSELRLVSLHLMPHARSRLRLYGQVNKRTRWMPRRQEAMKDVVACDKLRGAGKQAVIRRFPNGETHRFGGICI